MSTAKPCSTAMSSPPVAASQRILACVQCQQRKVKCDRKFPCANCVKARAQCVPANTLPPRQRRRRFPERELLERLRRYEGLLRQNNIDFEPLHTPAVVKASPSSEDRGYDSPNDGNSGEQTVRADPPSTEKTTVKEEPVYQARLRST